MREFGFSIEADDRSAHLLASLAKKLQVCDPRCLKKRIGSEVTILGHGPCLEEELHTHKLVGTVIAADGATTSLLNELGSIPDIIVTDLDGNVADQITSNAQGAIVVILAHGDNEEAIRRYVPWFPGLVTPTTQGRPFEGVFNFGGFTDGDRAVVLARHMGAKKINFLGFDFDHPRLKEGKDQTIKKEKLLVAKKIIEELNPSDVVLNY